MKLYKIDILGKDFEKIPDEEQVLLVHLAHFSNSIEVLQKFFYFSRSRKRSDILRHALVTQQILASQLLAGILWEGWQIINKSYFQNQLSKTFNQDLSKEGRKSLDNIKNYFNNDNIIKRIRNKFAFHYDPDAIRAQLSQIEKEQPYTFYISKYRINSLHYLAEEILAFAMLNHVADLVDSKDFLKIDTKIHKDILRLCQYFTDFSADIIGIILSKRLGLSLDASKHVIHIDGLPKLNKVEIPYFVERLDHMD